MYNEQDAQVLLDVKREKKKKARETAFHWNQLKLLLLHDPFLLLLSMNDKSKEISIKSSWRIDISYTHTSLNSLSFRSLSHAFHVRLAISMIIQKINLFNEIPNLIIESGWRKFFSRESPLSLAFESFLSRVLILYSEKI